MKKSANKSSILLLLILCPMFILSTSNKFCLSDNKINTDPCASEEELRPCVNNLLLFSGYPDSLCNVYKVINKKQFRYTMRMLNLKVPYSSGFIPRDSVAKAVTSNEIILFDFDQSGMFCPQVCKVIGYSEITRDEAKAYKRKKRGLRTK